MFFQAPITYIINNYVLLSFSDLFRVMTERETDMGPTYSADKSNVLAHARIHPVAMGKSASPPYPFPAAYKERCLVRFGCGRDYGHFSQKGAHDVSPSAKSRKVIDNVV
jgi:hypothetical protein